MRNSNLGQFRENYISITALLKFESKNPCAQNVTHTNVINYHTRHFLILNRFSLSYFQIIFKIWCFYHNKITLALYSQKIVNKNALKRAKTLPRRLFSSFPQNYTLKYFFISNCEQFEVFVKAKFEFNVTVHIGVWEKGPRTTATDHRLLKKQRTRNIREFNNIPPGS